MAENSTILLNEEGVMVELQTRDKDMARMLIATTSEDGVYIDDAGVIDRIIRALTVCKDRIGG